METTTTNATETAAEPTSTERSVEAAAGMKLLDLPCELLAAIASGVTNPCALASSCKLLRSVCRARGTYRTVSRKIFSRDTDHQQQKWLEWKMATTETLEDIDALTIPDRHALLFLKFIRPVLERAFAAAKTPEELAHVDRAAVRFAADRTITCELANFLLPDTVARLVLWLGGRTGKRLTQRLIVGGKMRDLPAGLALALWYAYESTFEPPALEREMQAAAKRLDQEANMCGTEPCAAGDRPDRSATALEHYITGAVSEELKWARVAVISSQILKAAESRVFWHMRNNWLHSRPDWHSGVMISARDVYRSKFLVQLPGRVVPAESLTAEEAELLNADQVFSELIPFEEFDGTLRAPAWLLPDLSIYY